jgi:Group II intron, maturase-specific domain
MIRDLNLRRQIQLVLADIAHRLNPLLRGWLEFYGRYAPSALYPLLRYVNQTLLAWAMRKFKRFKVHKIRTRACSHYPQPFGDEREVDEGHEHDIKFLEPREDAAKTFESAEQPFDLIAPLVHGAVVFPRRDTIFLGRNKGDEAKIERQLPRLVAFIRPIHQVQRPWRVIGSAAE